MLTHRVAQHQTHLLLCALDTKQIRSSLHPKLRILPMRQKHNVDGLFLSLGVRFEGSKPGRWRKGELCTVCATAVQAWQPECDTCNTAHDHTHIHISHARLQVHTHGGYIRLSF